MNLWEAMCPLSASQLSNVSYRWMEQGQGLSPFACWETSGERMGHNTISHCEILNVSDLHSHLQKHCVCQLLDAYSYYLSDRAAASHFHWLWFTHFNHFTCTRWIPAVLALSCMDYDCTRIAGATQSWKIKLSIFSVVQYEHGYISLQLWPQQTQRGPSMVFCVVSTLLYLTLMHDDCYGPMTLKW